MTVCVFSSSRQLALLLQHCWQLQAWLWLACSCPVCVAVGVASDAAQAVPNACKPIACLTRILLWGQGTPHTTLIY